MFGGLAKCRTGRAVSEVEVYGFTILGVKFFRFRGLGDSEGLGRFESTGFVARHLGFRVLAAWESGLGGVSV